METAQNTSPNHDEIKPKIPWWKGRRFRYIFGLTALVFAVTAFIAFTSYLFNWIIDYDKIVAINAGEFFTDKTIVFDNHLGKFGAILAHFFIYSCFGIMSFLLLPIIGIAGLKSLDILFVKKIKLFALTCNYVFYMLWCSILLALVFPQNPILGGVAGFEIKEYLVGMFGVIGTIAILVLSLSIFLFLVYNIKFFINPKKKKIINSIDNNVDRIDSNSIVDENIDQNSADEENENLVEDTNINNQRRSIYIENFETDDNRNSDFNVLDNVNVDIADTGDDSNTEQNFEVIRTLGIEEEIDVDEIPAETISHGIGTDYNPYEDLSDYKTPKLELLEDYKDNNTQTVSDEDLQKNKEMIEKTLNNFGVEISKIKAVVGPTITMYEIVPAPGVRINKIKNLEDDIALSLQALGIRIIAPIPGKGSIGIEVPNQHKKIVPMKNMLASSVYRESKYDLPLSLGKTIQNEDFVVDLAKMPHILMAGATGQGKSVGINAIIASLLYKKHPADLKFVFVDPKKVELSIYNKIERHFLAQIPNTNEPIITDTRKVVQTLNSLCLEMDQRYDLLKDAYCKTIKEYNAKFIKRVLNPEHGHRYLPYIILVIDEFADLIMTAGKEVEMPIARLAQLARAVGIHLIIATQRPSVNIITGTIKANFPARIAFRVTSRIDSQTILDTKGAEQLIGRGDMLFAAGIDLIRLQCPLLDTPEIEKIVDFIGEQRGYSSAYLLPECVEDGSNTTGGGYSDDERDTLFEEAANLVVSQQIGSTSFLQRKMKIGFARAGRITDQLEDAGIIGPNQNGKREVLIKDINTLQSIISQ